MTILKNSEKEILSNIFNFSRHLAVCMRVMSVNTHLMGLDKTFSLLPGYFLFFLYKKKINETQAKTGESSLYPQNNF